MNVTVYSTPSCGYCTLAKNYLKGKNVPFRDIDVSRDPAKADEMVKKSGQMGVPVLDIDGRILVGFNQKMIEKLLER